MTFVRVAKKPYFNTRSVIFALSIAMAGCATANDGQSNKDVAAQTSFRGLVHTTRFGSMVKPGHDEKRALLNNNSGLYSDIVKTHFNGATVLTYPAWGRWGEPDLYDFNTVTPMVERLQEYDIDMMAHLLFAPDQYFPEWFTKGIYTDTELRERMEDWISSVMTENDNGRKISVWNVLNEAFAHHGTTYKQFKAGGVRSNEVQWMQLGQEADASGLPSDQILNSNHPSYIREIFTMARKYTPNKLELRDWDIEFMDQPKRDAIYQLATHMVRSNIPIDAVGFQSHINTNAQYDWDSMVRNIESFKALGLEVYLTEIDIGDGDTHLDPGEVERQGLKAFNMTAAGLAAGTEWIQFWGVFDDGSWRKGETPLLFNEAGEAKPTFYGAMNAFRSANRLKVKAKGQCGGERLAMKINGKTVAKWTLSPDWSDYAYPWHDKAGVVTFDYLGGEALNCDAGETPKAMVEQIWSYGKSYSVNELKAGRVGVPTLPDAVSNLSVRRQTNTVIAFWPKENVGSGDKFNIYFAPGKDAFYQRLNAFPAHGPEFSVPMSGVKEGSVFAVTRIGSDGLESPRTLVKVPDLGSSVDYNPF